MNTEKEAVRGGMELREKWRRCIRRAYGHIQGLISVMSPYFLLTVFARKHTKGRLSDIIGIQESC